jgi:hypothetical protein
MQVSDPEVQVDQVWASLWWMGGHFQVKQSNQEHIVLYFIGIRILVDLQHIQEFQDAALDGYHFLEFAF